MVKVLLLTYSRYTYGDTTAATCLCCLSLCLHVLPNQSGTSWNMGVGGLPVGGLVHPPGTVRITLWFNLWPYFMAILYTSWPFKAWSLQRVTDFEDGMVYFAPCTRNSTTDELTRLQPWLWSYHGFCSNPNFTELLTPQASWILLQWTFCKVDSGLYCSLCALNFNESQKNLWTNFFLNVFRSTSWHIFHHCQLFHLVSEVYTLISVRLKTLSSLF